MAMPPESAPDPLSAPTGRPGDPSWYTRRFELALNLKTAKAIGAVIPPAIRLRVDRVVE